MASKLEHAIKQRDNLHEELRKKKPDDKADASNWKHLMELENQKKAAELDMQGARSSVESRHGGCGYMNLVTVCVFLWLRLVDGSLLFCVLALPCEMFLDEFYFFDRTCR